MAQLTPFAEMPATPEPLVAQLRHQLAADYPQAAQRDAPMLETIANQAIRSLWSSRVKTFVPVLALREARALAHDRGWDAGSPAPPAAPAAPPAPRAASATSRGSSLLRDQLTETHDTFHLPEHDTLRLG